MAKQNKGAHSLMWDFRCSCHKLRAVSQGKMQKSCWTGKADSNPLRISHCNSGDRLLFLHTQVIMKALCFQIRDNKHLNSRFLFFDFLCSLKSLTIFKGKRFHWLKKEQFPT